MPGARAAAEFWLWEPPRWRLPKQKTAGRNLWTQARAYRALETSTALPFLDLPLYRERADDLPFLVFFKLPELLPVRLDRWILLFLSWDLALANPFTLVLAVFAATFPRFWEWDLEAVAVGIIEAVRMLVLVR